MTTGLLVTRDTQTAYWEAILALEIDGTQDLQNATVKYLIESEKDS